MIMNSENGLRSSCRFVEALIWTSCHKLFMCAGKFFIARQRSRNSACYGWTVRCSKLGGGKGFSLLRLRPDTQPPLQRVTGLFTTGKAEGAWRPSPTPSSAYVKERVQLHLCSPSVPSWHVTRRFLPLHLGN
jgi:hypothetical protein